MTATFTQPLPTAAGGDTDAIIRCVGLTKLFRDFWLRNRVRAVDGIDLDVQRGEVFGLLGPNGSGKSTTIKLILGLLHPTAGRVLVFGKRADDVATKRQIGYLPEESYLYRFLNARETLDYYGRLFQLPRQQRRARIDMLLGMVGLDGVQRRPVGEYSKGMQRRIGLAQALINDPALLILDEPTSGLDPIGSRQIKDLIHELARRGKTILLCSHLLADVEDVCQRVAIMFGGKIRSTGTVDELLTQHDQTTLHTPLLDAETIAQIDALLQKRGQSIDRVDQPRQKLEALFLDIVQQAQAEGQATSGALSGGKLAEFLVNPKAAAGEGAAVIEKLVQPQQAPPKVAPSAPTAESPAPVKPQEKTEPVRPAAPAAILGAGGTAASEPPSPPAPSEESVAADLIVVDWAWADKHKRAASSETTPDAPAAAARGAAGSRRRSAPSKPTQPPAAAASSAPKPQTPEPIPGAGAGAKDAKAEPLAEAPTAQELAMVESLLAKGFGRSENAALPSTSSGQAAPGSPGTTGPPTAPSASPDAATASAPAGPRAPGTPPPAAAPANTASNTEKPFDAFSQAMSGVKTLEDDDKEAQGKDKKTQK